MEDNYETEVEKLVPLQPNVEESQMITVERLKEFMPRGSSAKLTQAIVDEINSIEIDTGLPQEYMEEKIISNMHMLGGSGVTVQKITNAIKYAELCNHYSNEKSWSIVFPAKWRKLKEEGRFVASHVSMFEKSDLVVQIKKKMMIPAYITYAPYFHESVMKQVQLMRGVGANEGDKVSAHVQHLAAGKLNDMTAAPEDNTMELKIGMDSESKSIQENLFEQLKRSTDLQMQRLSMGESVGDVQKLNLNIDVIEAEVE